MAASRGRPATAVIQRLIEAPYEFDFFQAVRLLERIGRADARAPREPVGRDRSPARESVRFRGHPSHSFPVGSIQSLKMPPETADETHDRPPEMVTPFMGLIGPNAALPQHYTRTVIERMRSNDFALSEFLDLLHHRALSLFFRAWDKYRVAETSDPDESDLFRQAINSLAGRGTAGLSGRLELSDELFLRYAGAFGRSRPQAVVLQSMLAANFDVPVEVRQFQGEWLYLSEEEQSSLPSFEFPEGRHNRLGDNVLIGERVWNVQSKFRLRVGPLDFASARRFLPTGDRLKPFCQLTRSYVGPEFDFDVQLVIQAQEVPRCRLGGKRSHGSQLGWNTWLRGRPLLRDADDAVFVDAGEP